MGETNRTRKGLWMTMEKNGFSIEEIERLADKVAQAQLGSIEVQLGDFHLKIEGKRIKQVAAAPAVQAAPAAPAAVQAEPVSAAQPQAECGTPVKSPIVGTFYSSPAPDKAPFVTPGKAVKKGDVLCIIESMKLMNEVLSEQDGVVKEILAKDGQAVEYGEPVMVME